MECPPRSTLRGVEFVSRVLAPLFLNEPDSADAREILSACATLDASRAVVEWPFLDEGNARVESAFGEFVQGARLAHSEEALLEYRRLFVGPFPMPCPPWGSVYMDKDCVVFGESTLALRSWMRASGIENAEGGSSPADHFGRMLALMGFVARDRPERLEEYLEDHFLTWADHYLIQLAAHAAHSLYRSLAKVTQATLDGLRDELCLDVRSLTFYR